MVPEARSQFTVKSETTLFQAKTLYGQKSYVSCILSYVSYQHFYCIKVMEVCQAHFGTNVTRQSTTPG